jgi:cell division protein FtsW
MRLATTMLMFCTAALVALGMVMLYSASMTQTGARYLTQQLMWCALGLVGCVVMAAIDYRHLRKLALPLLIFSVLALMLVLVPGIGLTVKGARRWIHLGPMNFQPSEMAKLAGIIALAAYAAHFQRRMHTFKHGLLIPGVVILVVAGLILRGKDYGATMLFGSVSAMMLLVAGVRWRLILPILAVAAVVFGVAIWHDPVRRSRVKAWMDPEQHVEGKGYQAYQAMLAIGAGGVEGRGLGDSRQKLGFVPEHHTDFILSVIGEELGLFATLSIVLAFMVFIICGALVAWRARDAFGLYLASGITFLIGLQAFINIGVVTSVLPNKGLPLPFISYGGSNLLTLLTAVGILLSVARQAIDPVRASVDPFSVEPLSDSQLS